jgi:Ca2+-binding EF-hand superfamily protein
MTRKTLLTLGALAAGTLLGAAALAGPGDRGPGAARMTMERPGGAMMAARDCRAPEAARRGMGRQARRDRQGGGPAGFGALTETPAYQALDTDGDGTVTLEEARSGAEALHAAHDADGDGALGEAEFAALFAEIARGMADRPFARLDADGDARISPDELAFPAQMMARRDLMQVNARETAGE